MHPHLAMMARATGHTGKAGGSWLWLCVLCEVVVRSDVHLDFCPTYLSFPVCSQGLDLSPGTIHSSWGPAPAALPQVHWGACPLAGGWHGVLASSLLLSCENADVKTEEQLCHGNPYRCHVHQRNPGKLYISSLGDS